MACLLAQYNSGDILMKYSNVIVSGLCMSMVSLATAAPTEVPSDEPVTL
ncbi:molybdenum ABC transporter substrate-binding protein, partial [Yersinia pestis]